MLVNIKINGKDYQADSSLTILKVCRRYHIHIPTLCYMFHEETNLEHKPASCRVCVVEVKGRRNLVPACATTVYEGMEVTTNSLKCMEYRKNVVELLLSNHPNDCVYCAKNNKCELQALAAELGIRRVHYHGELSQKNEYHNARGLLKNPAKCILCNRCTAVCKEVQSIEAIVPTMRGFKTVISTPNKCITCGQCIQVCPTGALIQQDDTLLVEKALADKDKYVIVNTAPAVRVSLGDEFGLPAGTNVEKKMVTSLRELGFDKVFDTNFGADLTIMEEANEFIERYQKKENLPLITSCCPGWVKFIEQEYPDLLQYPSSCKSPTEMFGAICKSYFAEKNNIPKENIVVVSLMPCLAKKREAARSELSNDGYQNVDYVLTVKEYAELLKRRGIQLQDLPDSDFDHPLGESSGAGDIFANTGGVIEAVARTASKWLQGEVKDCNFTAVRGLSGVREASVKVSDDVTLNLCICSGLAGARKVLEEIRNGTSKYDAIEIMACPGGCVNGGGQPVRTDMDQIDVIKARQKGIYDIDKDKLIRISCDNEEIKALYDEYLIAPGSKKAHELLHTHFHDSSKA